MDRIEDTGGEPALPLRTECIATRERFEAVRPAWDALAQISSGAHVYQSHPWISAWLRYGIEGSLRVFAAYRGERMTAALPLCLYRSGLGPLALRTLRVAADSSDFCDALCDPAFPDDLGRVWSEVTRRRDWHLMDLRYVRPDSLLAGLFTKSPRGLLVNRQSMEIAPYLDLREDWRLTVSKSQRTDWERRRRRLQEQGSLTLDLARSPDEVDEMLAQLAAMHVARWKARGETSVFALQSYRAQIRAVCQSMLQRGQLYFVRLALDGDPVSLGMHFLIRRHLLPYVFAFADAYSRSCPVHLMVMGVVDYAREHQLADTYDLGRGSEEYKLRWTHQSLQLGRLLVARRSPLAVGGYGWVAWGKPLVWRHYRLHTLIREIHRRTQLRRGLTPPG